MTTIQPSSTSGTRTSHLGPVPRVLPFGRSPQPQSKLLQLATKMAPIADADHVGGADAAGRLAGEYTGENCLLSHYHPS